VNPGGGSGWDEPPLDIQIPDDARELERDVIAYHRELRAQRRRRWLRRLTGPLARQGTVMPLLASILAVCLVAGAMLSVATFGPATAPGTPGHHPSATAASSLRSATQGSVTQGSATQGSATQGSATQGSGTQGSSPQNSASASASGAGPSGRGGTARPSGSANPSARSSPSASQIRPTTPGGP